MTYRVALLLKINHLLENVLQAGGLSDHVMLVQRVAVSTKDDFCWLVWPSTAFLGLFLGLGWPLTAKISLYPDVRWL